MNKQLTLKEFHISNNVKRAMLHIDNNPDYAKTFLVAILQQLRK